jgi:RimJ/RimL family protein N-acetyltransferase
MVTIELTWLVANAMAAFPARDRTAHAAHWQKVLAHESNVARTIVEQGHVVGYIGSWDADGQRLVGYWIGRDHWGRGIATRALADFVAEITERPLHACVAEHNRASIRVRQVRLRHRDPPAERRATGDPPPTGRALSEDR